MTHTSIIPYWLAEPPRHCLSPASANFWWFKPAIEISRHILLLSRDNTHQDAFYLPNNILVKVICVDDNLLAIDSIADTARELLHIKYAEIILWIVIEPSIKLRVIGQNSRKIKTIACVGDLHHMSNPITHARDFLKKFMFDYVLLTHDQYSHFFDCGDQYVIGSNILRFPTSLSIIEDGDSYELEHEPKNKIRHIKLIGSNLLTATHPLRQITANTAQQSGRIDLLQTRLDFNEWLRAVSDSGSVLTCSLNGSYSLQTLAPLAANRLLITDRISTKNHIGRRLTHMHNCLVYNNMSDLRRLISEVQSEVDVHTLTQIANNGAKLINKVYGEEVHMLSQLCCINSGGFPRSSDYVHYAVPDILVDIIETIQELHRLALNLVVIVSESFVLHKELIKVLDGLLPRLLIQCLSHDQIYQYAKSFGHTLNSSDHFYVQLNPLESAGAANRMEPCGLVCIKARENVSPGKCNALGMLQSVSGFPAWEQSQAYYCFIWLNSIQANI